MIRYSPRGVFESANANLEECSPRDAEPGSVLWLNVTGIHDVESITTIADVFQLHPLTLEDIVNTGHPPKAEEFDEYIFLVLKILNYDSATERIEPENVSLVLSQNYVLSFHERDSEVFNAIRQRISRKQSSLRSTGADFLAYSLVDAILDGYFETIEKIGERINVLDDEILTRTDSALISQVQSLKWDLLFLRKSIWPLREAVASLLRTQSSLVGPETRTFLRDAHDHTIQVMDILETYRDMIGGMHELFLSSINNRMNEVMKVLTLIATIFIPLTFISSIYGMNFANMPELNWRYGYFVVLAAMALVGLGLLVYFRRRKWF